MPDSRGGPDSPPRRTRRLIPLVLIAALAAWLWWPGGTGELQLEPDATAHSAADGNRRGALVDQVVFTQETDLGKVVELIETGSHQLFAQGISNATVFRRMRSSLGVRYERAFGSSAELTLNPVGPEFSDGRLNPFHIPAIREALNWLVDRRYIAEELYGGLAVPRVLPLNTGFPDYARLADVVRVLEIEYAHDPERARSVIDAEMRRLGAQWRHNRWTYQGSPVQIRVLIRTDDQRRRVGDYVSALLEEQGFTVERLYRAADEASRIWIAGDPAEGRWQIYTGGWVSLIVQRDQAGNFAYYYTPLGRPEPLWQAYQPASELQSLAERLTRADYTTLDERQAMMANALKLAMADSVRVWLADIVSALPRSADVQVTADLAGGFGGSALWPYTLRYRDRVGGSVVVGLPALLAEPWNPIAGSNWVFDQMIMRGLTDTATLPDPYTGLFWPQHLARAEVAVQADVPVTRTYDWIDLVRLPLVSVPNDAWVAWDAERARWITVGESFPEGLTARTRVTMEFPTDFLERRWHDGTRLSLADLLVPWVLAFERADPSSPLFDRSHALVFEVFRQHFKGMRLVSSNPLIIEMYSDQTFLDAEMIVAARAPTLIPWHTLAIGISAETQGELAFSSAKADQRKVDWMSFATGPSLAILDRHRRQAQATGWIPFATALTGVLNEETVAERYRALADWFAERGHFWVDNGPFYLHSVHPVERSVVLRRFDGFPDPADKWLQFDEPRIPMVDLDGPMIVRLGEAPDFELCITFLDAPYPETDVQDARYLLFDGRGRLHSKGDAAPNGNGCWAISLDAEAVQALGTGANSLEVAVTSRRVSLPAFATHAFATVRP